MSDDVDAAGPVGCSPDGEFGFGPSWARGSQCCGKPVGCTNMGVQCMMLNHPWKRWHRETYGPPDPDLDVILGVECPACGDTYHDLPGHLASGRKGCAGEMPGPAPR